MKKITLLLSLLFVGFSTHAQFDWSSDPLQNGWVEYAGSNGEGTTESWTWFDDGPSSFMYITWEAASSGLLQCQDWLVSPAIPITNTTSGLSFQLKISTLLIMVPPYQFKYQPLVRLQDLLR